MHADLVEPRRPLGRGQVRRGLEPVAQLQQPLARRAGRRQGALERPGHHRHRAVGARAERLLPLAQVRGRHRLGREAVGAPCPEASACVHLGRRRAEREHLLDERLRRIGERQHPAQVLERPLPAIAQVRDEVLQDADRPRRSLRGDAR